MPPPRLSIAVPQQQVIESSYRVDDTTSAFIHPTFNLIINQHGVTYKDVKHAGGKDSSSTALSSHSSITDFQLKHVLGKGGSSIVYYAEHVRDPTIQVAIKQISVHEQSARHQLYKELVALYQHQQAAATKQPSAGASSSDPLLQFYGCFYQQSILSLVLEYMDVGSLHDIIHHNQSTTPTSLPENLLSYVLRQMLLALHTLRVQHQVHRDIKPSNVLLSSDGSVKVSDFGLTTQLAGSVAQANTFVGTFQFMSPERILGQRYSYSSDLWSVGLVALEAVNGIYPYENQPAPATCAGGTASTAQQPLGNACNNQIELIQTIVHGPIPQCKSNTSMECQSFIAQCLVKDASKRATAQQLLQHPFITQHQVGKIEMQQWLKQQGFVKETGTTEKASTVG